MPRARFTLPGAILSLLIIFIALPFPREGYSLVFKIYTVGFLSILFVFVLASIRKKTMLFPKFYISFPLLILPLFSAIVGFKNGNNSYYVIRELFLFLLPILVFIVIINCSEDIKAEELIKLILWVAIVTGIFLLAYEIFGHLFQFKNRFQFRFEYVSRNTGFVSLAYILYLFKSKRAIALFWPGSLIIIASLVLTMGRLQWGVVLIFSGIFLWAKNQRLKRPMRALILAAFLITPILYLGFLLTFGKTMKDTSIRWRVSEANIIVEKIQKKEINVYVGNGFGYSLTPHRPLFLFHGESLKEIQRFHSLFLYLLVKTGILGIIAFSSAIIILCVRFSRTAEKGDHEKEDYFLLVSYFAFIFLVDGCTTGHFSMNISAGMELGLFLALMEIISRQNIHLGPDNSRKRRSYLSTIESQS